MTLSLFTDGGVILRNPSPFGGTWAFYLVDEFNIARGNSGLLKHNPIDGKTVPVTNNQTEMLALLYGLQALPLREPDIAICCDSHVTLGRVFWGWRWKNIPTWMHRLYQEERDRLQQHWDKFKVILLDGHPTKAQLAARIGKRGHPVSEYNVKCDLACQWQAERYMAIHGQNQIP